MISPKLLISLLVVGSGASYQINERQVVGEVVNQLEPVISQAIGNIGATGGYSSNVGAAGGYSSNIRATGGYSSNIGATGGYSSNSGATRSYSSNIGGGVGYSSTGGAPVGYSSLPVAPTGSYSYSGRVGGQAPTRGYSYQGATGGASSPAVGGFSGSLGSFSGGSSVDVTPSVSSVTSSVVSQLQPSIKAAVTQSLRGVQRGAGSGALGGYAQQGEQVEGPPKYQYDYKVADDEAQAYMAHQEARDGEDVQGSYSYVDATGSLVTVNYQAGPQGYTETRDVQENAVQMRNQPGAWTGPLAGVDDVVGGASGSVGAQTPARLAPVQSFAPLSVNTAPVFRTQPTGYGGLALGQANIQGGNSALVSNIVSSLRPNINSVVSKAIQSSSRGNRGGNRAGLRSAVRGGYSGSGRAGISGSGRGAGYGRGQASISGNSLTGVFGAGGSTSVRLQTPDVNVEY